MPSANVELINSIFEASERGDYSAVEWAHPEIETVFADGPTPGSWTGVAGAAEGWRDFLSAWEGYHATVEEYHELDEERVLVLIRRSGRGKRSGIDVASAGAVLYQVRDGRVIRQVAYYDRGRALAEFGLAPGGVQ